MAPSITDVYVIFDRVVYIGSQEGGVEGIGPIHHILCCIPFSLIPYYACSPIVCSCFMLVPCPINLVSLFNALTLHMYADICIVLATYVHTYIYIIIYVSDAVLQGFELAFACSVSQLFTQSVRTCSC